MSAIHPPPFRTGSVAFLQCVLVSTRKHASECKHTTEPNTHNTHTHTASIHSCSPYEAMLKVLLLFWWHGSL